ncbi:MAG: cyclic pyranopterin monophosphate synthase MoaC [Synergistaceae bacterium]|nr:cyclic pyranopterin monophosphate synthase MoaC [Synergistaceae bacterium]
MVDVGGKAITERTAEAEGWVLLDRAICDVLGEGALSKKGDVLRIAETAGIMAVKRTWELIPLCHPIRIDLVKVSCELISESERIHIKCLVGAKDATGVEMEALTGVSVAALTIYDMCKAVSKGMTIEGVRLLSKTGGKSGDYRFKDVGINGSEVPK